MMADGTKVQTAPERGAPLGKDCAGTVWRTSGMFGHRTRCRKVATARVNGSDYCSTHDPDAAARREAKAKDRRALEDAWAEARRSVKDAERALVVHLTGLGDEELADLPAHVRNVVNRVHDARRAEARAAENARAEGVTLPDWRR